MADAGLDQGKCKVNLKYLVPKVRNHLKMMGKWQNNIEVRLKEPLTAKYETIWAENM